MRAINENPLSFFLAANLLTGIVNLVFPTLVVDSVSAILILIAYLVSLTIFAFFLSANRIRIA